MKRSLFALLGLSLVIIGSVGCGGKDPDAEISTAPTSSNPQATPGMEQAKGRGLRVPKDGGGAAQGR